MSFHKPRKTILRNTEVAIDPKKSLVVQPSSSQPRNGFSSFRKSTSCSPFSQETKPQTNNDGSSKFAEPYINTCRGLLKRLSEAKNPKRTTISGVQDLTPRSKGVINEELTKQLNFPSAKPIYKHLIPINVNDSILISTPKPKTNWNKYKSKSLDSKREPEPELDDFLSPDPVFKLRLPLSTSILPTTPSRSDTQFEFDPFANILEHYENFGRDDEF